MNRKVKLVFAFMIALVSFQIDAIAKERPSGRPLVFQTFAGQSAVISTKGGSDASATQVGVALIRPLNKRVSVRGFLAVAEVDPTRTGLPNARVMQAGVGSVWKLGDRVSLFTGVGATHINPERAGIESRTLPTFFTGPAVKIRGNWDLLVPVGVHEESVAAGFRISWKKRIR